MRRFTLSLPAAPSDAKALSLFLYTVKRIPLVHLFSTCLTVSISIVLQNTSLPHFAGHPFLCKIGLTLDCGEIRLFLNCSTLFPSYFDSQMAIWEHWYLSLPIHEISAGNVTDFGSLGRQIFHPVSSSPEEEGNLTNWQDSWWPRLQSAISRIAELEGITNPLSALFITCNCDSGQWIDFWRRKMLMIFLPHIFPQFL